MLFLLPLLRLVVDSWMSQCVLGLFLRCRWKGWCLFCSISFQVISSLLLKDYMPFCLWYKSFSWLCTLVIVLAYIACGLQSPTDPRLSSFSSFLDFHLVAYFSMAHEFAPWGGICSSFNIKLMVCSTAAIYLVFNRSIEFEDAWSSPIRSENHILQHLLHYCLNSSFFPDDTSELC